MRDRENGGEGDRTPDLVNAIHALSQLSYAPVLVAARWVLMLQLGKLAVVTRRVKQNSCRFSLHTAPHAPEETHDSRVARVARFHVRPVAHVTDHLNLIGVAQLGFLRRTGRWAVDASRAVGMPRVWAPLVVAHMRRLGVDSIPISLFLAVFTGIVLALLASYIFTGAVPLYFVGALVAKTIMMELGPVLTGMALAGRVGANIAAELGTMKVTEQVDALETLAVDVHAYLVVPRVVAATLMFPVVTALAIAVGVVSGWITATSLLDLSTPEFFKGVRQFYQFKDIWFGLLKSASFGCAIAIMGALTGLRTQGGAEGVGRSTTRAVVLGCEAILVLDAFWALVLL